MNMGKRLSFFLGVLLTGFGTVSHVYAATGSGSVTYIETRSNASKLGDGKTIVRTHSKGVILSDDSGVSFHLGTQDCQGTVIISVDGSNVTTMGFCDAVDKGGDVWSLWYLGDPVGSTWGVIGGTGKYKGMTGSGTTKSQVNTEDGRLVIRWEGSWEMQ